MVKMALWPTVCIALSVVAIGSSLAALVFAWQRSADPGPLRRRFQELEERILSVESESRRLETEWASQWDKFRKLYARLRARWETEAGSPPIVAAGDGSLGSPLQQPQAANPVFQRTELLKRFHATRRE